MFPNATCAFSILLFSKIWIIITVVNNTLLPSDDESYNLTLYFIHLSETLCYRPFSYLPDTHIFFTNQRFLCLFFGPPPYSGACLHFLSREGFGRPIPSSTMKSNFVYSRIFCVFLLGRTKS